MKQREFISLLGACSGPNALNSLAAQPIGSKACSDLRGDPPREFPPLSDRLHHEQQMRVLISGAGIARLTVASWLRRYGYSDHSRAGTITTERVYKIEVRGIALQVLRRMGVHDAVVAASTDMQGALLFDGEGKVIKLNRIARQLISDSHSPRWR